MLSKQDGRFSESDSHFIEAFVFSSASAIVHALMPQLLMYLGLSDDMWTIALLFALILGGSSALFIGWRQYHMTAAEAAMIHWGWHFVAWGIGAAAMGAIITGLLGLADEMNMFIVMITMMVILALWSFVAVVFRKFFHQRNEDQQ